MEEQNVTYRCMVCTEFFDHSGPGEPACPYCESPAEAE